MKLTVTGRVTKKCPYKNEVDYGTATLTFELAEVDGPELHGLAQYLNSFDGVPMSHEQFTRVLASDYDADVETTWHTAGLEVRCVVVRESDQLRGGA